MTAKKSWIRKNVSMSWNTRGKKQKNMSYFSHGAKNFHTKLFSIWQIIWFYRRKKVICMLQFVHMLTYVQYLDIPIQISFIYVGLKTVKNGGLSLQLKTDGTSLMTRLVKNLPAMQETRDRSSGQEYPLEKGMEIHHVFLPGEFHGHRNLIGV